MTFVTPDAAQTHRSVDTHLVNEVFENIHQGHSAVLLGHRYNGSSFLIQDLKKRFKEIGFQYETMPCLKLAAQKSDVREFFNSLSKKHASSRSWVLIANEMDALPATTARWLLEEIRTQADRGHLKVVVTGQHDLRDLIQGPKSEITSADHYVIQGLSPERSARFASEFLGELQLPPDPTHPAQQEIWRFSGGNTFLMRAILWATIEYRTRRSQERQKEATASEIQASVDAYSFDVSRPLVMGAARAIEDDPDCWPRLEALLECGEAPVDTRITMGGTLTLAGIAKRIGDQLHFASTLMERFTRDWFASHRIADLYARRGEWKEAIKRYQAISPRPLIRPYNRDDRADVAANLDALVASLNLEVRNGIEAVCRRFADGCRWVLGFPDVVFWRRNQIWRISPSGSNTGGSILSLLNRLPKNGTVLDLPSPLHYFAEGAVLDPVSSDQPRAVVVGDFEQHEPISQGRRKLLKKLIEQFLAVYGHAVEVYKGKARLEARNQHAAIVDSILDAMSSHVLYVGQIIDRASERLKGLGYQEVQFALLDGGTGELRPVGDELSETESQNQVLTSGQAVRKHNYGILPIKSIDEFVIGTIYVERTDGLTPSATEIGDLELFARQMSTAIRYSERVQLIQSTLDRIPDPVLTFDVHKRMRYANAAAAKLFGVNEKWQKPTRLPDMLEEAADDALQGIPHFHYVESIAGEPYRGDLSSGGIDDWQARRTGGWIHLHDLNDFHGVLTALSEVANATTQDAAIDHLLAASNVRRHGWVRVYFVDPADEMVLRSERGTGFPGSEEFSQHTILLRRGNGLGRRAWMCIEERKPLLFCFEPKSGGSEWTTDKSATGIPLFRVHVKDDMPPLEKQPGDYWLDFPLIADGRVLGKVSMGCDETLTRQTFEGIAVLSGWLARVIHAFRLREQMNTERHKLIEEMAQRTMADMAHNLNTEIAGLGPLLERYRRRELTELKELNDAFSRAYDRAVQVALSAKGKLGVVKPTFAECRIEDMVRGVFSAGMSEDSWSYSEHGICPSIHADTRLLSEAFSELMYNARKAWRSIGGQQEFRMSVAVHCDASEAILRIRDNGPGIDPRFKDEIFSDFFHTHYGTAEEGQGLGLSRVQRVIVAHGGSIREIGTYGDGACFEIRLPVSGATKGVARV